jgi:UDP-N-acetyl-2-amino-2-deoxyglucuronate dehydrogenase
MDVKKIRFVIVGSGNISNTYVKALKKIENAELIGVVSRTGKKPSSIENENLEVADSIKKIKSDFDAVILCTPNGLHHESAIEAASVGKHVLTEKPLDISIESMDAMINSCKKANVKLAVAYQRRTSPDNVTIKKLIEQKKLGKIFAADLSVKNYRDDNYYKSGKYRGTWNTDGGGPFMQQASHNIDLYGWFFGKPEKVVSFYDTFTHNIETEDHGAALLRHSNGMIGTIIASTVAKPGFAGKLEIHSELGTIVMENDVITKWLIDGVSNPGKNVGLEIHSGASTASVEDTQRHEAIIHDFITSIIDDREPIVSGESARIATEIILQIYNNRV